MRLRFFARDVSVAAESGPYGTKFSPRVLRRVSRSTGREIHRTVHHVKERSAGFSMIYDLPGLV